MTDFLSHLVDRALDVAPVLERRRGSRFEPVRELMRPAEAIAEVNDMVDASRPAPSVSPRVDGPVQRVAESPVPGVESSGPIREVVERVVQPTTEVRQPEVSRIEPRFEDNRPEPQRETIVERHVETHTDHRITVSPTIQRHVEHRELVREVIQPAPPVAQTQQRIESSQPQREVHIIRRTETASPPASAAKPQTISTRLAPQTQSPRAQKQAAVSKPIVESTPPAIHVTIGRIEIKATNTPAQPSRQRALTPKMSLDEYLKARSGGGR